MGEISHISLLFSKRGLITDREMYTCIQTLFGSMASGEDDNEARLKW